jgi:two-component system sensor histidine kinase PilS (NtrC family)
MGSPRRVRDWLSWLVKVRFILITFLLGIELVIRQLDPSPVPVKYFVSLILIWYALSVFYAILQGLELDPYLQAYVQLGVDLLVITGLVHVTRSLESYMVLLYPPLIIVATILLSRVGSFFISALSFLLFAGVVEAAYFKLVPVLYPVAMGQWPLQVHLITNLVAFFGVWYLSSYLAESLRRTGVALEDKVGEIAELQAFNENIIQSMRGGLLTTDLGGRIVLLNPAAELILGVSAAQARGQTLTQVFPELAALAGSDGGAEGRSREEVVLRAAGGQARVLGVSCSTLRLTDGGARGTVFNFLDETELKRLEREVAQKERMAAVGRLAATIAHEIRNPLGAIAGSVRQLARYRSMGADEQALMDIVNRESDRLNRVVNEILSYGKEKVPQRVPTDIVQLLEETLLLLERHPQFNTRIEVEKRFPPRGVSAAVDASQMKQVFWNLCDNALRAMPSGGTLRVGVEEDDGVVRLCVADTGVGLTLEQCERIFDPFESTFAGGTGLGLAVVYQIVRGHGGRVWARPVEPHGSEFTVELPR